MNNKQSDNLDDVKSCLKRIRERADILLQQLDDNRTSRYDLVASMQAQKFMHEAHTLESSLLAQTLPIG